jgi:hypothetical protein
MSLHSISKELNVPTRATSNALAFVQMEPTPRSNVNTGMSHKLYRSNSSSNTQGNKGTIEGGNKTNNIHSRCAQGKRKLRRVQQHTWEGVGNRYDDKEVHTITKQDNTSHWYWYQSHARLSSYANMRTQDHNRRRDEDYMVYKPVQQAGNRSSKTSK